MQTFTIIDVDELREVVRQAIDRPPRLYSIPKAAGLMDVSPSALRHWIDARRFPAIELSEGSIRVAEEDIANYIATHRREAI